MSNSKIDYPQPISELEKIAHDIFLPISKHLCLACFFISGTGKRIYFKFLIKEEKILKKIFGKEFPKTLFVYVDPDEIIEESNEGYLKLMKSGLEQALSNKKVKLTNIIKNDNPLMSIKNILSVLITKGWHVVFILNDFEFTLELSPTIFRNLESVLSLNKTMISFMFLATKNLLEPSVLEKFHNLKFAINRTTYYYPMMNENQINFMFKNMSNKTGIKLTESIKESLVDLCGGHVQLLKYSFTYLKELNDKQLQSKEMIKRHLLSNSQLKTVCSDIWNFFSTEEKQFISNFIKAGIIDDETSIQAQYLLKTHIIRKDNNKYEIFGELFKDFVKNMFPKEKLVYDPNTKQIYYGVSSCTDRFTLQEFKLLVHFINNEDKVISRDEVGQILWGSNYVEKFSDWSIDKIISTIRKKLKEIGYPANNLTTLKRRGFSFNNAA